MSTPQIPNKSSVPDKLSAQDFAKLKEDMRKMNAVISRIADMSIKYGARHMREVCTPEQFAELEVLKNEGEKIMSRCSRVSPF